ncbi:MAG: hypothetical protein HKN43_07915 [Rhodothermales bacterium]|nr:hypothetical protein [Rhodothermales bacterium]
MTIITTLNRALLVLILAFVATGCATRQSFIAKADRDWEQRTLPNEANEVFRVFLIGDTGSQGQIEGRPWSTLQLLNQELVKADSNSAVVFLGDNIYCCGLPDSTNQQRGPAEAVLDAHIASVEGFKGRVYFVPGNHDWNNSKAGGLESVARQERYLEERLGGKNILVPDGGFPGPHVVELTDGISMVALDTEWWLTDKQKSFGDTGEYEIDEEQDFFLELDDVITNKLDDDNVLVVAHHPMFSNGEHGAKFDPRVHLFPLSLKYDRAYLPLPILGTLAATYLKVFGGSRQDIANSRYRQLRNAMTGIFSSHESLVYASGHEHSLQHFRVGPDHLYQDYIVSGSGSRPTHVAGGNGASFAANPEGFAILQYYRDRSVWLSFWDTESDPDKAKVIYRKKLRDGRTIIDEDDVPQLPLEEYPDYSDSIATQAINPDYAAGPVKSFLLGSHNRDLWTEPVSVPYLDMGREAGGLTPIKRGGGMQTVSLRLAGADGREYVLRSLDKDPSGTVPEILKGTIATDIVQDQITSINPYGAFIIPDLAQAAGVYHTQPRIVYMPDDPRLGPFRGTFANKILMFEDRPDDDESDQDNYGNSEDVESASKMYREITEDNDNRVDQLAFARVRLFDMLLSDWDRHRGQWRWSSFDDPDGKGDLFKPIPRDRDWAFNKMNGLPTLASQFDAKFQDFRESFGYLKGLTLNGHEQDRRLLNAVSRDEWIRIATEIQAGLTDDVIDLAVSRWPASIQAIAGEETARLLKIRRDKLHEIASEYYTILAGVADWVGSDKHEQVIVRILPDGSVEMEADKTSKDGEFRQPLFSRTYHPDETREIRIFGLDGNDRFSFQGAVTRINIIVVGGAGDDTIENTSRTRVRYYDTHAGESNLTNISATIQDSPAVNEYDPLDFRHDARLPQLYFGHNSDDGVFVGGGLMFVKNGFRKTPFARSRKIIGNISGRTGAFNIQYESVRTDVSGVWDAVFHTYVSSPATIRNFYGFGNDTERTEDRRFYESRLIQVGIRPYLRADVEEGLVASFGPTLTITQVEDNPDRFLAMDESVDSEVFETQVLAGLNAEIGIANVEGGAVPTRGFRWLNSIAAQSSVSDSDDRFIKLTTDLRMYMTPVRNRITLALRLGTDHLVGDFPYHQSSSLGGNNNLRGFLKDRFNGRTSFYQSGEIRIRLADYSTYLTTGKIGLLGFIDNGRVWFDGQSSNTWHQGYGGGIWTNLLGVITLSSWVATSTEYTTYSFKFGFQY